MRKSDLIWAMLVLTGATSFAFANAYKWENKDNQTEYSQVPPSGVDSTVIPPPPPPSSSAPDEKKEVQDINQKFQKEDEAKAKAKAEQQQKAEENKVKNYNCQQARTHLKDMESKARIKLIDAQGNAVLLTQEQRAAEIEKTKEAIKAYCNP